MDVWTGERKTSSTGLQNTFRLLEFKFYTLYTIAGSRISTQTADKFWKFSTTTTGSLHLILLLLLFPVVSYKYIEK